jgi:hypothetical protein
VVVAIPIGAVIDFQDGIQLDITKHEVRDLPLVVIDHTDLQICRRSATKVPALYPARGPGATVPPTAPTVLPVLGRVTVAPSEGDAGMWMGMSVGGRGDGIGRACP